MLSQSNVRMVMLVMLVAIMMAVAGSLFFRRGTSEETTTTQTEPVEIDGVLLQITGDPAQRVTLVGGDTNIQTVLTLPQTQPVQATTPPEQAQQTEQLAEQQATAVPPTSTPVLQTFTQPATSTDPIIFIGYTVQGSDTLYSISSSRMDTSIALMARFNISAEDIVAGNVIQLPIGNPAYCPGSRPYAVGEGDTAYSIARRFGTNHDTLKAMNNLDANYTIRIAEIICVP